MEARIKERWNDLHACIQKEVLKKLPCEPIGFNKSHMTVATVLESDMNGKDVPAVVCVWIDKGDFMRGVRKAYFALETGTYLGDGFLT